MNKQTDFERGFDAFRTLLENKTYEEREPPKRKDADVKPYIFCKYIDAGMEGMHCHKGLEYKGCCRHLDGYVCSSYEPKNTEIKPKNNSVKNYTEFEKGEWNMFEAITSSEYGKQRFFLEKDGEVYDKKYEDYLKTIEEAYSRYFKELIGD